MLEKDMTHLENSMVAERAWHLIHTSSYKSTLFRQFNYARTEAFFAGFPAFFRHPFLVTFPILFPIFAIFRFLRSDKGCFLDLMRKKQ